VNEDNGKSVDVNTEEVWGKVKHYKYERVYPHAAGLFREHKDTQYHKNITKEMTWLGKRQNTIFLGQNVINGNYCGTLKGVPLSKRIEMPVAEELQMGMSIGLSLEGYVPISCYPRMDFLPRALDQIINHLELIAELSYGVFKPKVIIRTSVGLENAGMQHNKDLKDEFSSICNFPVMYYGDMDYKKAYSRIISTMVIERQELYG
jgi:pyruvate/2-oxoglutarate/acetoin dehydrogenase E1 component